MNIARRFCLFTIFIMASFSCFAQNDIFLSHFYSLSRDIEIGVGLTYILVHKTNPEDGTSKDYLPRTFKTYIDEYGYKTIEINKEVYKIIDGERQYVPFPYINGKIDEKACWWIKEKKQITKHESQKNWYYRKIYTGLLQNPTASSTLTDKYQTYHVDNIFYIYDIDSQTDMADFPTWTKEPIPWVEGKKDDGIGEYIQFDVYDNAKNYHFKGIDILNGYVDPLKPHLFYQNNRIKEASIIFDGGTTKKTIKFNDYVEYVFVPVPEGTKTIKIVIDSVYPGTKFRDTCITSIVPQ